MNHENNLGRRRFLQSASGVALGLGLSGLSAATVQADVPNGKGRAYYLSSSEGGDDQKGTIKAPWKTLAKISSVSLHAGDKIYFKAGDRFDGHFVVNGSGSDEDPILISSYGAGPKPILTGQVGAGHGGDYQEAIYIQNADNIILDGLDVRNERKFARQSVRDIDAFAVNVSNTGTRVMKNITLRSMTFQKVYAVQPMLERSDFDSLLVAAVRFTSSKNTRVGDEKNIQNILVENCYFTDIQRLGIQFMHAGGLEGVGNDAINRNMDVVVRNNIFHHLGGTSVLPQSVYNCLIEHNLFDHPGSNVDPRMPGRGSSSWPINCINTVLQHNRCLSTRGYADSCGIHIDLNNLNTFIQYNYMEDCEGGFVEILGGNVNSVYRFNVSVNDAWRKSPPGTPFWKQGHTLWVSGSQGKDKEPAPPANTYIYNNTICVDQAFPTSIDIMGQDTFIYNNIFYSTKGGKIGGDTVSIKPNNQNLFISSNLFFGDVGSQFTQLDARPVTADPTFSGKGEGLDKYQLMAGSPAIGQGLIKQGLAIPGAGKGVFKNISAYPTIDAYGNPIDVVPAPPNIGACNAKRGELSA
ncbi:MAG: hypothetical protein WBQ60_10070 [Asticcacaulis sp.]